MALLQKKAHLTAAILIFSVIVGIIALWLKQKQQTMRQHKTKCNITTVLEAHNLNKAILEAITTELESKINNLSKEFSWRDKFSFIKNIDYTLEEYKKIIGIIEEKIFYPFQNEEKQDIL